MAKGKGSQPTSSKKDENDRPNHKAFKKHPKIFDAIKRKLVPAK